MRAHAIGTLLCIVALMQACGGGGSKSTPPPPPPTETVTINYLRVEPAYDGWGLHLWGNAIDASVATEEWDTPRGFDRIENGAAVFEIPIINAAGSLNFIAHNGDLKSPIYNLSISPQAFGLQVWIVQDSVAALNGDIGVPFDNETDALAARLKSMANRDSEGDTK